MSLDLFEAEKAAELAKERAALRDRFAAAVLPAIAPPLGHWPSAEEERGAFREMSEETAVVAYAIADAMLAQRERKER